MLDKKENNILNQQYLSAQDLMRIIPKLTYKTALKYIKDARIEMLEKGYFIPESKTFIALTKIIRKKFGL